MSSTSVLFDAPGPRARVRNRAITAITVVLTLLVFWVVYSRLEEKGQLRHEEAGPRYVYIPMVPREKARRSALRNVLQTFFNGSTEDAVAALLDLHDTRRGPAELDRLAALIANAKREGR